MANTNLTVPISPARRVFQNVCNQGQNGGMIVDDAVSSVTTRASSNLTSPSKRKGSRKPSRRPAQSRIIPDVVEQNSFLNKKCSNATAIMEMVEPLNLLAM
jgi:hypothetical protein